MKINLFSNKPAEEAISSCKPECGVVPARRAGYLYEAMSFDFETGWIKIHRKIKNHWVYQNDMYFKAWITILLEVNHDPKKILLGNQVFTCERGQSYYSVSTWAKKFGKRWDRSKTRRFIELLKNDSMIELKTTTKTTILTVCNYDKYQDLRPTNSTTDDHQTTIKRPQLKNDKNEKNKKYIRQAERFKKRILHISPETKITSEQLWGWANEFRLIFEIDKRSVDVIEKLIDAVFEDDFWCKNIRSVGTLRKQYNSGKLTKLIEEDGWH